MTEKTESKNTLKDTLATGRRKKSVARVRMEEGKGQIIVNNRPYQEYFLRDTLCYLIRQPLIFCNCVKKYDFKINVKGGGIPGQVDATRLGMARALSKINEKFKSILRKKGLLTRDPREKERKKYGQKGARKRFQFSKR